MARVGARARPLQQADPQPVLPHASQAHPQHTPAYPVAPAPRRSAFTGLQPSCNLSSRHCCGPCRCPGPDTTPAHCPGPSPCRCRLPSHCPAPFPGPHDCPGPSKGPVSSPSRATHGTGSAASASATPSCSLSVPFNRGGRVHSATPSCSTSCPFACGGRTRSARGKPWGGASAAPPPPCLCSRRPRHPQAPP